MLSVNVFNLILLHKIFLIFLHKLAFFFFQKSIQNSSENIINISSNKFPSNFLCLPLKYIPSDFFPTPQYFFSSVYFRIPLKVLHLSGICPKAPPETTQIWARNPFIRNLLYNVLRVFLLFMP